jgi:hypothetical protein
MSENDKIINEKKKGLLNSFSSELLIYWSKPHGLKDKRKIVPRI